MTELIWHVGDVVRKLRQAKGWTQKQLAKAAAVHHNTIVRMEDGDEGVQARTLKVVAAALDVTSRDLYAAIPQETHRAAAPSSATAGGGFSGTAAQADHKVPESTRSAKTRAK